MLELFQLLQICWFLFSRQMEKKIGKSQALEPLFEGRVCEDQALATCVFRHEIPGTEVKSG